LKEPFHPILLAIDWNTVMMPVIVCFFAIACLLFVSALMSGSEAAFFSLSPSDRENLSQRQSKAAQTVLKLLDKPKELLAVILIVNNFVNIGVVLIASYLSLMLFPPEPSNALLKFIVDVVVITFLILLFGEVIPKIYSARNGLRVSLMMSIPLWILNKTFPFNFLRMALVKGSSGLSKGLSKRQSVRISSDELEQALELTQSSEPDNKILRGIVNFGNKDVKQIMKSRLDVIAYDSNLKYDDLYTRLKESSFSRIPIFNDSFDNIEGILHVKDLLAHINAQPAFNWQRLLREPYFVPENKKIDDLLKDFQEMKMHMAIVVDEYGGKSGIVTLEDVLEEIVGDISGEYDDEDLVFSKLDEFNYVFEGKTSLVDMYRIMEIDGSSFEEEKSDSDTIAGFVIEQAGKILKENDTLQFHDFTFTVEASDKRKITRIKVTRSTKNAAYASN